MNILVTVGTTPFEELIIAVDHHFSNTEFSIVCQISSGNYQPKQHSFVRSTNRYSTLVAAADIVISHGGAASVFELLEAGKKIVIVPNFSRIDKHQEDLAFFIETHQYGVVCRSMDDLLPCVKSCQRKNLQPYQKDPFFMSASILQFFGIPM